MSRLLLDTHTLLWYAQDDARLPAQTVQAIQASGGGCFISRVSLWEVAIKSSLGKLVLPGDFTGWQAGVQEHGFSLLEITDVHLAALHRLAYVSDHRDPFDRLLIAQAKRV
ncbi:type II toxin-antitoxin system VapC family toxin [Hymenobacter caeli]|uniref:PIN domain nuclease of toxin-antitoxin system n=1 Tax=Hymenobacter caeli TaxID=2735894 RepID=A0ABX2FQ44_9BACT|nr:type II toxin-antitoxin system VapC family toxin [Hymenobacter caeli]NRT18529.1 PIN domain nuclease of toxin-antitoxin system [Hymenobacter caeli]